MYYKVVYHGNKLFSAAYFTPYKVEYKLNKWTYPHPDLKGSKLFVFNSLVDAKKFVEHFEHNEQYDVYECEVKNPKKLNICAHLFNIKQAWDNRRYKKKFTNLNQGIPTSTIHVDAVKLVKKVT